MIFEKGIKGIKIRFVHALIAALIAAQLTPVNVAAEELTLSEDIQIDSLSSEEIPEDLSEKETKSGEITAIDTPEISKLSFEYKPSLDTILDKLPKTVELYRNDSSETVNIRWKCDGDYDEALGEYPFIPDMEGYELAKDLKLPCITVTFDNEVPQEDGGLVLTDQGFDIPSLSDGKMLAKTADLPSYYNLEEEGKLPPIKDQGSNDTCWAFSATGCMEADLIKGGESKKIDLSELHLAYYSGNEYTDPKKCRTDTMISTFPASAWLSRGANLFFAARTYSDLIGAVKEKDAPYDMGSSFNPGKSYVTSKDYAQLKNAYYIKADDIDGIKKAIMDHNGVGAGYGDNDIYYSSTHNSYYSTSAFASHAVMLVGWDDNFSKNKFKYTPEGNGAWLVRNSYGYDGYGHFGYFWMSYYDKGLRYADHIVAFDAVKKTYTNCYAYDGQMRDNYTMKMKGSDKAKVTYKVSGGEAVKAVALEIASANVKAKVTAKNKKTGKSVSGSVHTTYAGIYTVKFGKELQVPSKADIEITVTLKADDGGDALLVLESTGQEIYSGRVLTGVCDGGFTKNGEKVPYDARIKLYTVKGKKIPVTGVKLNKSTATVKKGKTITLKATVKPTDAANTKVKWKSSKPGTVSVSSKGVVKGKKKGTAWITVTTEDGNKTAKCKVTVK